METIERIKLRDELFEKLKEINAIYLFKGYYRYNSYKIFITKINKNLLNDKYNTYIKEFRSEEEAIYCILHQDDFENHRCSICNNICDFYLNTIPHKYNKTCKNKNCIKELINSKESVQKGKDTKERLYGDPNYNNREGAKQTCMNKYGKSHYSQTDNFINQFKQTCLKNLGVEYPSQSKEVQKIRELNCLKEYRVTHTSKLPDVIKKGKDTRERLYGDPNYNNRELARQTMINEYGAPYPMQVNEFKEHWRNNYQKNNNPNNLIESQSIIKFLNKFNNIYKQNIKIYEIYGTDKYFIKFIKHLHKNRKRLLKLREIANIFGFNISQTIKIRAKQLNLLKYFDIHDSELEIQFEDFLVKNSINNYNRKNHILQQENGYYKEIDFLIGNIGFEINDIATHNSKIKDQFYHINKTLQCKEKNIKLIHLWEWELTDEDLWRRTSNWILNLFNLNKIQINSKDCIIKEINKKIAQNFISEYNLYDYIESDVNLGLYYNNELLQVISFKLHDDDDNQYELLQLCIKFGYEVKSGIKELLNYFINQYNPFLIITIINLDKFIGHIFEELGFKLIQYKEPQLISHKENEISNYKKIYNCGQNIYILEVENGE